MPVTYLLNGDWLPFTHARRSMSRRPASIERLIAGSSTGRPGGASTSSVAEASAASGKVILSWSSATCEDAPGMRNSSSNGARSVAVRTPHSASSTTQAATTRHRARKQALARR